MMPIFKIPIAILIYFRISLWIKRWYTNLIKYIAICFRIKIDGIRFSFKSPYRSSTIRIMPNNLVPKLIFSKYFVHKNFYIVPYVPIQMHIDRSRVTHNSFDSHKILIHPIQIAFLVPNIAIHLFFEVAQFFAINLCLCSLNSLCHFWVATYINFLSIIGTTCKRRIDINKVYFQTFPFKISTSRKTFATKYEVMIRIFAHHFLAFYFVERHATLNAFVHLIVITIAKNTLRAHKVIEYSLSFEDIGIVRNIFDCHNEFFYLKN